MSRSTQTLTRAIAAAFDFDVVTDTPARRPLAAPAPKEPDPKAAQREAPQRSGGVTSEAAE
jgi:hypothetical protein